MCCVAAAMSFTQDNSDPCRIPTQAEKTVTNLMYQDRDVFSKMSMNLMTVLIPSSASFFMIAMVT